MGTEDTGDRIDALVGRCIVQILDPVGHCLYLCHPVTHELFLIEFSTSPKEIAEVRRQLQRIVLAIVFEALQETGLERRAHRADDGT